MENAQNNEPASSPASFGATRTTITTTTVMSATAIATTPSRAAARPVIATETATPAVVDNGDCGDHRRTPPNTPSVERVGLPPSTISAPELAVASTSASAKIVLAAAQFETPHRRSREASLDLEAATALATEVCDFVLKSLEEDKLQELLLQAQHAPPAIVATAHVRAVSPATPTPQLTGLQLATTMAEIHSPPGLHFADDDTTSAAKLADNNISNSNNNNETASNEDVLRRVTCHCGGDRADDEEDGVAIVDVGIVSADVDVAGCGPACLLGRSAGGRCEAPRGGPSSATLWENAATSSSESMRSVGSLVCRICHNCENPEKLVSPCLCKGSLSYVHIHCLERWISMSRCTVCELCQFRYNTIQTLRYTFVQSLRLWYSRALSRRALQEDCQMFSLLTLVAFAIVGTLLVGIQFYFLPGNQSLLTRLWTKGWLLFFLLTTLSVYLVNIYMIVRTQLSPWYRWWQSTRDIKLILENRRPFQIRAGRVVRPDDAYADAAEAQAREAHVRQWEQMQPIFAKVTTLKKPGAAASSSLSPVASTSLAAQCAAASVSPAFAPSATTGGAATQASPVGAPCTTTTTMPEMHRTKTMPSAAIGLDRHHGPAHCVQAALEEGRSPSNGGS